MYGTRLTREAPIGPCSLTSPLIGEITLEWQRAARSRILKSRAFGNIIHPPIHVFNLGSARSTGLSAAGRDDFRSYTSAGEWGEREGSRYTALMWGDRDSLGSVCF